VIDIIDVGGDEWRDFVAGRPEATPFHHPGWTQVITSVYGFSSRALVWREAGGEIAAGLPAVRVNQVGRVARWRCLPFTDRCGALGPVESVDALLRTIRARPSERWEIRDEAPAIGPVAPVAVTHRLDLTPGTEELFRGFHKSQVQRAIKKAEKEPRLRVREGHQESDLTETYYDLHVDTRKRQGVPPQPRRLFAAIWRTLHDAGLASTLIAELDGEPIAGAVFLSWNGTVVYKYGASLAEHLRARPNHLIFWSAIQRACENGDRCLDFGRTDFDNEGLRTFKRNWGAVEEPLLYSYSGSVSHHGPGRAQAVVAAVIKRSPPRVCEWIGTALYRYAA
jgi:CelD/BcsL family acetyltransferase involved in cellulose biosynthesis